MATPHHESGSLQTRRVEKPWGYELIWAHTEAYVGKILHVREGEKLSYQFHETKVETLRVLTGRMTLRFDRGEGVQEIEMGPGDVFHVAALTRHRMIALCDVDILEVSTPELDDVVRLEDSYGREGTNDA